MSAELSLEGLNMIEDCSIKHAKFELTDLTVEKQKTDSKKIKYVTFFS